MNRNKASKETHPNLPGDDSSSKNNPTSSILSSNVASQSKPSTNVQTVTPAGPSINYKTNPHTNPMIDERQSKRSWKSNDFPNITEKDPKYEPDVQHTYSQKPDTHFPQDANAENDTIHQEINNMHQPHKKQRHSLDRSSKSETSSQIISQDYVTQGSKIECPLKNASHSDEDIDFKDSNSAISSACSSPSQNFDNDDVFVEIECKDGESSVGGEGSGSIGSGNSSTSSYLSYNVPPAPPSTPASVSYRKPLVQRDLGMAPPLPPTHPATSSAQTGYHQDHRFDPSMTSGLVAGSQDLAATPLPYKSSQRTQNSYARSDPGQAQSSYTRTKGVPDNQQGQEAYKSSRPSAVRKEGLETKEFNSWKVGPRYELIRILGRGSYGEVAQARDLHRGGEKQSSNSQNFVAIKRITSAFEQEVDAIRIYREMHILRRLRGHECIIQLLDVIPPESDDLDKFNDLYLVFEYVDTDLYKLIMSPQYLTTEHIRTFLYQMLTGLKYIHSFSVIHRDLKPANILLNEDCSLKICDFGLARIVHREESSLAKNKNSKKSTKGNPHQSKVGPVPTPGIRRQLTKHVVTRWYRAPELILIQPYTSAVDIWSIGCILAELLSMQEGSVPSYEDRVPLFPGGSCYPLSEPESGSVKESERRDQLSVIFSVIGTPSDADVASIEKANSYIKSLEKKPGKPLQSLYPAADKDALGLLTQMLQFNPANRCTVDEALEHEFLKDVRNREMEITAQQPLVAPSFLESPRVDIKELKRRTYEEVMWYREQKQQP